MKRKSLLVGVLVIVVVIAAVASGTYAIFTDTEAAHVQFEAGTIDIEVNGQEPGYQEFFLNPAGFDDWKPGDHAEWVLDIHNKGNNKAWIQIYVYPTGPWEQGRANFWDVATYEFDAPSPWNEWILPHSNHLMVTLKVDFPQWAGNDYQGAQGDLLILIVAKQWRNKFEEGYSCVALENKDLNAPWLPHLDDDLEGIVCYKPTGNAGELEVDVNAYGLTPDEYYQLSLNGTGGCSNFEDVSFAGMSGSLYHSGWYYFDGMLLHDTCTETWHEGCWNFTGTDGEVQASGSGSISWGGTLTGLPQGNYDQVKFLVKHITGYTDPPPGPGDYGTTWTPVLMEMDYLNFQIP